MGKRAPYTYMIIYMTEDLIHKRDENNSKKEGGRIILMKKLENGMFMMGKLK